MAKSAFGRWTSGRRHTRLGRRGSGVAFAGSAARIRRAIPRARFYPSARRRASPISCSRCGEEPVRPDADKGEPDLSRAPGPRCETVAATRTRTRWCGACRKPCSPRPMHTVDRNTARPPLLEPDSLLPDEVEACPFFRRRRGGPPRPRPAGRRVRLPSAGDLDADRALTGEPLPLYRCLRPSEGSASTDNCRHQVGHFRETRGGVTTDPPCRAHHLCLSHFSFGEVRHGPPRMRPGRAA